MADRQNKSEFSPYRIFSPVDPQWQPISYRDLAKPRIPTESSIGEIPEMITHFTTIGVGTSDPSGAAINAFSASQPQLKTSYSSSVYADFTLGSDGALTIDPTGDSVKLPYLTLGSVLFASTGGKIEQDNANFFWDDTNNSLGLGCTDPFRRLEVRHASLPQLVLSSDANNGIVFQGSSQGLVVNGYNTTDDANFFSFQGGPEAQYMELSVYHTDATGTDNHAMLMAQTGGAGAGDPFVRLYNSVVAWSAGLHNADSDKYKISQNANLGTNDFLTITTAGVVTVKNISLSDTSNQAVFQSAGVTGTLTWTPATSNKVVTFPNATGTVMLTATASGLFTQGSVLFADAAGLATENNASFFWDNANSRLGIGTNSPQQALHVTAKGRFGDDIQFDATGKALVANTSDGSDSYYIGLAGGGGLSTTRGAYFELAGNEESSRKGRLFFAAGNAAGPTGDQASIVFNAGGGDKAILLPGGNFGIGTSGPDRRLDVLDASNPQLRLTHTDGSVYCDFQVDSGGDVVLTPSGNAISFTPGTQVAQDTDGLRIVRSVASSHTWTQINSYGGTSTFIASVNGFSVQGEFAFYTADNGVSITNRLYLSPATAVVNEDGADCDFRVEGDTVTHLLFVDAGSDFVAIGSPETVLQTAASFRVFHASTAGMIVREKTNDIEGEWFAYNSWPTGIGAAVGFGTVSNHGLNLITNDTTRACITAGGNVGINTAGPDRKLDILDASNPQLRLTYTDGSVYTDFQTDSSGNMTATMTAGTFKVVGASGTNTYIWADQAGASQVSFTLNRSGGTAAVWTAYIPSGSTDLRFFDGTDDRVKFLNGGNVYIKGDLELDGALNHDGASVGFFGATPTTQPTYTISNVTTDRSYDADATTLAEVADALGTLIADLRAYGLVL